MERYAELAQRFPASENHHYAYPGGMLNHGLEIVVCALELWQARLLPVGVTPEEQAGSPRPGRRRSPMLRPCTTSARSPSSCTSNWPTVPSGIPGTGRCRFRYRKEREYHLHYVAAGLLYHRILTAEILD